jgi:hypothetical protein
MGKRHSPEQSVRELRHTLPDEPPWLRRSKRVCAKGLRIALKLARGAYW